jgi:hypothetical protein
MIARAFALWSLVLGAAGAQQQQPVRPATLPADWAERDLEGKWSAYRAAVDGNAKDATVAAAWASALGRSGDVDLLEWIGIFEGWRHAGPELQKLDAPQLLRVAVWNLGALDSHAQSTAHRALLERGDKLLGWLAAHPNATQGRAAALQAQLTGKGVQPAPADVYLSPLDPMQVLVPWLDAPANLAEMGGRRTAEPRGRYVHQVVRALGGVLVLGDVDDLVVAKVVNLARHGHAAVRNAAFSTLCKLPGGRLPVEPLQRLADDPASDAERRRLATMALSFSTHPLALQKLQAIAADAAHPAWDVAVARLGEAGDPSCQPLLARIVTRDEKQRRDVAAAIATLQNRQDSGEFCHPGQVRKLLQRVAWLRTIGDPTAADAAKATAELLGTLAPPGRLASLLGAVLDAAAPVSPFRGDEAERVEQALVAYAKELMQR